MDKAMAAASRKKVFDMVATDTAAFPSVTICRSRPSASSRKFEQGYRFVPETYQFEI